MFSWIIYMDYSKKKYMQPNWEDCVRLYQHKQNDNT